MSGVGAREADQGPAPRPRACGQSMHTTRGHTGGRRRRGGSSKAVGDQSEQALGTAGREGKGRSAGTLSVSPRAQWLRSVPGGAEAWGVLGSLPGWTRMTHVASAGLGVGAREQLAGGGVQATSLASTRGSEAVDAGRPVGTGSEAPRPRGRPGMRDGERPWGQDSASSSPCPAACARVHARACALGTQTRGRGGLPWTPSQAPRPFGEKVHIGRQSCGDMAGVAWCRMSPGQDEPSPRRVGAAPGLPARTCEENTQASGSETCAEGSPVARRGAWGGLT